MNNSFIETFLLILTFILTTTILAIDFFTKRGKKINRVLALYVFYVFLSTTILQTFFQYLSVNQYLKFRTATLFEGICFTILFYQLLKSATAKKVLIGAFVLFLALSLIDLTTSKAQNFDTIPTTVESLIFLSFSIFYFYEELQKINTSTFLYNTPTFWIISGIMIYFSGCFFFFIFAKQLISKPEFQIDFSQIMQSFSIIQLLFFLVAFIMAKSNSKNSPLHGTSKNPYPSLQTKEAFKP